MQLDTNCQFSSLENYSDLKMARICIVYITPDILDMRYSDISMKMCERSIGPFSLYTYILELLAGWEQCHIQMAEMVFSCYFKTVVDVICHFKCPNCNNRQIDRPQIQTQERPFGCGSNC
jgi:hypothetical protein